MNVLRKQIDSGIEPFQIIGYPNRDRAVVARKAFKSRETVYQIAPYKIQDHPTPLSVQIADSQHVLDRVLEAMNHSCRPTTFVDCRAMLVIAMQDIAPGDELTFFYPSTEWRLNRPFRCECQQRECIVVVDGAEQLIENKGLMVSEFMLNPHIQRLVERKVAFQ